MNKNQISKSWKRYMLVTLPLIFSVVLLLRFISQSKAKDIQKILQSLSKDLTQNSERVRSEILLQKFEQFSEQILKKQDEQVKNFEKERRILEKKIQELKQVPNHFSLRQRLATKFEYGPSDKFSSFIWQTWPHSDLDDNLDPTLRIFEKKWQDKNPGFVHEILNDETALAMVHYYYSSIPEVIEAYKAMPTNILRVDFLKYLILLARGGVYADIDTNPHQPIPNWIPENVSPKEIGIIIGIEHDGDSPDWKSTYVKRLQFGNWIIQAKSGHPIIREVVARVTEKTLNKLKSGQFHNDLSNDLNIMEWTGSAIWTDVIFTYLNDYVQSGILDKITWKKFHNIAVPRLVGDVLVMPKFSFNAPANLDASEERRALQLVSHQSMKSWKHPNNH